tara:strand:- start:36 stop:431 length:396 start_codon:yes stop_codon:yes gene_type:complete
MVNKVILVGNLGRDPETREAPSGGVCKLRLATSHGAKDRDGGWTTATEWHNVVVFGRDAENCQQYLAKGRQVYIEGRVQTRSYTGRDGQEKQATEIVANRVAFLQGEKQPNGNSGRTATGLAGQYDEDIPF